MTDKIIIQGNIGEELYVFLLWMLTYMVNRQLIAIPTSFTSCYMSVWNDFSISIQK